MNMCRLVTAYVSSFILILNELQEGGEISETQSDDRIGFVSVARDHTGDSAVCFRKRLGRRVLLAGYVRYSL